MHKKSTPVNIQRVANTSRFNKRIGSVTYQVGIHFKKDATETMDKKIMRLIKNEMGTAV
ncbi:MAG: transposon-encoded TnpW family protein [Defluviitaleaceae bacterium]|nr:transposon-encoded TnpW family protein [Defluviitaleaceae bacterium]